MLLVLDNYDSFTWNLVQYLRELGATIEVIRNDERSVDELLVLEPERVLVSPGPCSPTEAGVSVPLIRAVLERRIPLLGVCLGHQSLAAALGGRIVRSRELMHGKTSPIQHDGTGAFAGLPQPFTATRYHSLAVAREDLPAELIVNAWTEDGEIMGLRHRELAAWGVQFHPESILSEHGHALLENFLRLENSSDIEAAK